MYEMIKLNVLWKWQPASEDMDTPKSDIPKKLISGLIYWSNPTLKHYLVVTIVTLVLQVQEVCQPACFCYLPWKCSVWMSCNCCFRPSKQPCIQSQVVTKYSKTLRKRQLKWLLLSITHPLGAWFTLRKTFFICIPSWINLNLMGLQFLITMLLIRDG